MQLLQNIFFSHNFCGQSHFQIRAQRIQIMLVLTLCRSTYLLGPVCKTNCSWRLKSMDLFVVEFGGTDLSKRWNSVEFVANDSFFGGTLIILGNGNDRLFVIPIDIDCGRLNIVLLFMLGVCMTIFTGVFDFFTHKNSKFRRILAENHKTDYKIRLRFYREITI